MTVCELKVCVMKVYDMKVCELKVCVLGFASLKECTPRCYVCCHQIQVNKWSPQALLRRNIGQVIAFVLIRGGAKVVHI